MLFDTAASTLNTLARDPRQLGADIGFTMILHTWGQNLQFHPHLHCVVTGGGLRADGRRWIEARDRYYGSMIGRSHGEPLRSPQMLALPDPLQHFREHAVTEAHAYEGLR